MPKGKFLSGPEPIETEELTEAQKNDLQRPSFLSVSDTIFKNAEDDQTPAIDQKVTSNNPELTTKSSTRKPKLSADADFEHKIKDRTREERAMRKEHQKQLENKAKTEAEAHQKEIEEKLQKAQTLDPEQIEEELAEQTYQQNQGKLYPDAKPIASDVEDAIWKKRTENGAQIAARAKLESTYDSHFSQMIKIAIVAQLFTIVFATMGFLIKEGAINATLAYTLAATSSLIGIVCLIIGIKKNPYHTVPNEQTNSFRIATIIPGLLIRFLLIAVASLIPLTGQIVGVAVGTAIGASIHYTFLNNYGIYVSTKDTLINTAIAIIPLYIKIGDSQFGVVLFLIYIIEFILADRFAMLLAYRTNK